MSGNAHRSRTRARVCSDTCVFCKMRPKLAKLSHLYRNKNGHRHNPAAGKKQNKKRSVIGILNRIR